MKNAMSALKVERKCKVSTEENARSASKEIQGQHQGQPTKCKVSNGKCNQPNGWHSRGSKMQGQHQGWHTEGQHQGWPPKKLQDQHCTEENARSALKQSSGYP